MNPRPLSFLVVGSCLAVLLLGTTPLLAKDLEIMEISEAYDYDENVLQAPVFESDSMPPVVFEVLEDAFDRNANFVRRIPGGFVRAPRYGIAPSLKMGAVLTDVLRAEAATMGLRSLPSEEAVKVSGKIPEFFLECRGIFGGALMFFGYLEVDLTLTWPDGREENLTGNFHGLHVRYNGGFGARDEAREATGRFMIDSAQEIVARLAREHLEAQVHSTVAYALDALSKTGVENHHPALRRVGLSGLPEAGAVLVELLAREKQEDERGHIIDALASLGDLEALSRVAARYPTEPDEDTRFFSLKAFAYSRTEEGEKWIADLGTRDKDRAVKRLAEYLKKRGTAR